jgi:hypothetical protein
MKTFPVMVTATATLALAAGGASAAVQIKQPDCGALEAWGGRFTAENYNVAPRLQLPKGLEDAQVVPLFGVGVLAWTQEDLQAANQLLVKCWGEAGKRRDQNAANALVKANQTLQGFVPRTNAALQKAKSDAEPVKKQIDALPNSAELDRGLGVLLAANPAAPEGNAYQGLPREIVDPLWRLAQIVTSLANGEREALYKSLGERRAAIQAATSADAEKAIAAAGSDAAGIISLMAARQRAAALSDAAAKAKLEQSADQRIKEGRDALRQAKPAAWIPPECLDFYGWAAAPNATTAVNVGDRGALATAFLDQRVVPVFGISLADWSDQDITHFKALRAVCQAEVRAQAAIPGKTGPNATALVQVWSKGRWIDDGDRPMSEARTLIAAQRKGQEALTAAVAKVQALPNDPASLAALNKLAADPSLASLSPADRNAYMNAINAKVAAIGAISAEAAVKGLDDVKVDSPADLDKLWTYGGHAAQTIPDPRNRQAFLNAFTVRLQQAAARLEKAPPDAKPASLASVAAENTKILQLRTASLQVVNTPVYQAYFKAVQASRDALAKSARGQACTELASSVGAGGDAPQALWNGRDAITLGELLCEAAEHGTVNSYSGPGLLSSTSTLKVTPLHSQMFSVSMHKVEVQAGKQMLVGYEVKDAAQAGGKAPAQGQTAYSTTPNGPITVEGWELFLPNIIGLNGSESTECAKIVGNAAPDQFAPAAKVFFLYCWTLDDVRERYAKSKGW